MCNFSSDHIYIYIYWKILIAPTIMQAKQQQQQILLAVVVIVNFLPALSTSDASSIFIIDKCQQLYPRPQRNVREWGVCGSPRYSRRHCCCRTFRYTLSQIGGLAAGAVAVLAVAGRHLFFVFHHLVERKKNFFWLFSCIGVRMRRWRSPLSWSFWSSSDATRDFAGAHKLTVTRIYTMIDGICTSVVVVVAVVPTLALAVKLAVPCVAVDIIIRSCRRLVHCVTRWGAVITDPYCRPRPRGRNEVIWYNRSRL